MNLGWICAVQSSHSWANWFLSEEARLRFSSPDKAAVKIDIQAVRILAPIWNQVHDLGRNVRISIWF